MQIAAELLNCFYSSTVNKRVFTAVGMFAGQDAQFLCCQISDAYVEKGPLLLLFLFHPFVVLRLRDDLS